ncbi:phosphatase PAP2 family protein [Halioglobus pacificus]|uniref:undecaprenyl-diphosphate phosphatase n=2 Tax=Parahalioglobus pacificus TaxID=930806 RepID=A0A919CLT1_9GAMM|nr:phosphatase PAP2 family protein [Halioglobus pacificus]
MSAGQTLGMDILTVLQQVDHRLFHRLFQQGERGMIRPLAKALSRSGDGYLHMLIPALLWLLPAQHIGEFCALLLVALTIERSLYWILKNSLKRRRPQALMPNFRSLITASDQFSFPSGHSSGAFLLATALGVVYGGPLVAMFLWASLVALSRVVLGVHFPGDTVAGAVMGTSITLLTASLLGIS